MLGELEPLKALQDKATRDDVINRILADPEVQIPGFRGHSVGVGGMR
jgi:hypothetical protein